MQSRYVRARVTLRSVVSRSRSVRSTIAASGAATVCFERAPGVRTWPFTRVVTSATVCCTRSSLDASDAAVEDAFTGNTMLRAKSSYMVVVV